MRYHRSFGDKNKFVPTGGTFSANPLVATAGLSVLNILNTKDYNYINQLGELMRSLVNANYKKTNSSFSYRHQFNK